MAHIKSKWIIKYEIESKYEFYVDKRDFQQILIQRIEKQLCEPEINFEIRTHISPFVKDEESQYATHVSL